MASDKMRAAFAFAKLALAAVVGYGIYYMWLETHAYMYDEYFFSLPYVPVLAGVISLVMVFFLLSRLNKGSGD
ncbi:MAG: hypothetical protein WC717_01100 [Candidatus Micrarchaeia archaeon]|jgi:hypothetical protein